MAIETVTLFFTSGEKFEITSDKLTSGNIMTLPTKDLEGQEFQVTLRFAIPNDDEESMKALEAGLEGDFGNT